MDDSIHNMNMIDDDATIKLLKKSAHYRDTLRDIINCVINSVYYKVNISKNKTTIGAGTSNNSNKFYIQKLNDFFIKEYKNNMNHLLNMDFKQIFDLKSEMESASQQIDVEKTSNSEFPQDEYDLIINLKEELSSINFYWEFEEYQKYGDSARSCFKNKEMDLEYYRPMLERENRFFYIDIKKIVEIMLKLTRMYDEYNQKFPNIAFERKYN